MMKEEINMVFRFRDFPVYKDLRTLRSKIKSHLSNQFPKEERYRLKDQLWRAVDSVVLNLAESCDQISWKSRSNYIRISIGSLDEVVAYMDAVFDDCYVDEYFHQECLHMSARIMKQLRSLYAKIRKN